MFDISLGLLLFHQDKVAIIQPASVSSLEMTEVDSLHNTFVSSPSPSLADAAINTSATSDLAQQRNAPLSPAPLVPPRPDIQPLPETLPPSLPPVLPETVPPPSPEPYPVPEITITIRQVNVLGNTVFSEEELQSIIAPFIGIQATFEDLLRLRAAITDLYTSRGYTTSGAFLPAEQDVTNGVITIQVVEGQLEQIDIQGLRRLRTAYVRNRIQRAAGPPVNINELERALQLLQLDPLFESVQAELTPGTSPGQSILQLTLQETPPLHGSVGINNYESPSTGSLQGTAALSYTNILGLGDQLAGSYQLTEGVNGFNVSYAVPLNASNGTLQVSYEHTASTIVEDPFAELGIDSNAETLTVGFRQPFIHTPTQEFALGLAFDLRQSQTYLFDDEPFSFSEGPENGKSRVAVLRFSQDWLNRSPRRVLAARSQFSLGLDAFDATINDIGTDGQFFSWVGQFQWVQAVSREVTTVARVGTQLTPDSLLPLEQFSIGGVDTVRGYRQDELIGDNGIVGSIEVRVTVVRDLNGIGLIQLVPFLDVGSVWNNKGQNPSPDTLLGTGLGLRWQLGSTVEARIDYGIPLIDVEEDGESLQDQGILFSIVVNPF